MSRFIYGLIFFICFSSLGIHSQVSLKTDSLPTTSIEWNELNYQDIKISYPSDWSVDTSGMMGLSLILLSPLEIAEDQFRENVNVMVQNGLDSTMTLDAFVELSESQILQMITDPEIISSDRRISSEIPFHDIAFTGTQGIFELHFIQRYYVINSQAYVLTFTMRQTTFDRYKEYITPIFDSFSF